MNEFSLNIYSNKAEELRQETKATFEQLNLATDVLPATMQPDDGAIKLVFVGQYSAGKSSIIKMISGIETEIGAGITTQESHVYKWNDLELIDTPGIQTGLRADHDEITYDQISKAALLVFVVTNEGFDQHMGEHFRKLAIEQKRGSNMVLVINKMDRAPEGNSANQQQIIRDDICKVLGPLTPEAVYTSFISTQSYEEYLSEEDEEIKAELLAESGREQLIANLNAFVQSRQVTAKIERPLYTLQEAVRNVSVAEEINMLNDAESFLGRKQRILQNGQKDAEDEINSLTMNCQWDIIEVGKEAAGYLEPGVSEEEFKAKLKESGQRAEQATQDCIQSIERAFGRLADTIQSEMDKELASTSAQKIFARNNISVSVESTTDFSMEPAGSVDSAGMGANAKAVSDVILGTGLSGSKAFGMSTWNICNSGLKNFSGSMIHTKILDVGKFFGVKFKPWEAVGLAKNLARVGTALNILGFLLTIWGKFKSDAERQQKEQGLRESKEEIRANFKENADTIYGDIMRNVREKLAETVGKELDSVEESLRQIAEERQKKEECKAVLEKLSAKIDKLCNEIEAGGAV